VVGRELEFHVGVAPEAGVGDLPVRLEVGDPTGLDAELCDVRELLSQDHDGLVPEAFELRAGEGPRLLTALPQLHRDRLLSLQRIRPVDFHLAVVVATLLAVEQHLFGKFHSRENLFGCCLHLRAEVARLVGVVLEHQFPERLMHLRLRGVLRQLQYLVMCFGGGVRHMGQEGGCIISISRSRTFLTRNCLLPLGWT